MLKLIVCIDKNWGIAKDQSIPWKIPAEREFFKKIVDNQTIVMGHNTYKSVKNGLSSSKKIVFSNDCNLKVEGIVFTNDIQKIVKLAQQQDVFVIGGKQIYNLFLNETDQIIISQLKSDYECDLQWKPNLKFFKKIQTKKYQEFEVNIYQSYCHKLLDGGKTSLNIIAQLTDKCKTLIYKYHLKPKLVVIFIGKNLASQIYVERKKQLGLKLGIDVEIIRYDKIEIMKLEKIISDLNSDKDVNGILIQHPLPDCLDEDYISNLISPLKDVDCFHPLNIGMVFKNVDDKNINSIPCTPLGILTLLKSYDISLKGKNIVILGRSNIVGKPLVPLFLNENATVTICHSKTNNLKAITKQADILIVAIGKPNIIDHTYIKKNSILVDVGISRDKNNLICGDVNFIDCIDKVCLITPVPGGVGPMTLVMLFQNLLNLYQKQKLQDTKP